MAPFILIEEIILSVVALNMSVRTARDPVLNLGPVRIFPFNIIYNLHTVGKLNFCLVIVFPWNHGCSKLDDIL